ncbi:hypothetical protein DSO57_1036374 [Entomophthora muscae]|uniref:Uncharacterized protein n=1 Tax=Entomophthora muscae TaxID=34485 RepID=A0ACC2TXS8_9FUNG|nr:hypothetical protein DSO57_1036374 [Entomophthora muscae]
MITRPCKGIHTPSAADLHRLQPGHPITTATTRATHPPLDKNSRRRPADISATKAPTPKMGISLPSYVSKQQIQIISRVGRSSPKATNPPCQPRPPCRVEEYTSYPLTSLKRQP